VPIKSILCAYSGGASRGSGLRHAIKLARHHNAHLAGVLRHGKSAFVERVGMQIPEELVERLQALDAEHIDAVKGRFLKAADDAGLGDVEFIELDPERDGELSEVARAYDLIVSGTPVRGAKEAHLSAHPDAIALRSGRPVLVVPNDYQATGLADRAVVAWDGKRSAARALSDAMDVLSEKSHVTLLSVGSQPAGTERAKAKMLRHGISVDAKSVPKSGSIAETLLAEAEMDGAKLMVMGAFEHSKFAHDLFGGVTTDVIEKAPFPIFMAH